METITNLQDGLNPETGEPIPTCWLDVAYLVFNLDPDDPKRKKKARNKAGAKGWLQPTPGGIVFLATLLEHAQGLEQINAISQAYQYINTQGWLNKIFFEITQDDLLKLLRERPWEVDDLDDTFWNDEP